MTFWQQSDYTVPSTNLGPYLRTRPNWAEVRSTHRPCQLWRPNHPAWSAPQNRGTRLARNTTKIAVNLPDNRDVFLRIGGRREVDIAPFLPSAAASNRAALSWTGPAWIVTYIRGGRLPPSGTEPASYSRYVEPRSNTAALPSCPALCSMPCV